MAEETKQLEQSVETLQIRQKPTDSRDRYILMVAIDFGTTFSGYAFAFTHSPDKMHMNKNWGDEVGYTSYKNATSVLIGPGGEFDSFGFEAENKYSQMVEGDKDYAEYSLFRHFKMMLYQEQNLTRSTQVSATNGKKMAALEVFSMALKYLKKHLMDALSKQLKEKPKEELIRWILTVPAIWGDEAKQFMREAAQKAEIIKDRYSKHLIIALEPEAASIFCRDEKVELVFGEDVRASFREGTKYMVIDAGGGTIDITAHKVFGSGNVKELLVANGGSWGGARVDQNFVNLLKESLGDFIEHYQKNEPNQWLTLMLNFEKAKKIVKADGKHEIRLQLSFNIFKSHFDLTGKELDKVINQSKSVTGMSCRNGSLVLTHEATMKLFMPVIFEIQNHVVRLLEQPVLREISHVMLVGGFAECAILQEGIKEILPKEVNVLIPQEAQLAIIKGAVTYGLNPRAIESRFVRKTYGVDMEPRFKCHLHRPDKKVVREGKEYCNDVFDMYVKKGDSLEGNDVVKKIYFPRHSWQPYMTFDIFYTDQEELDQVEYVDSGRFRKAGFLVVDMPKKEGAKNRKVEVEFRFGGTEIEVSGKDLTSGEATMTTIDLLID